MTANLTDVAPHLANLALKASLGATEAMVERTPGLAVAHRHEIDGNAFLELRIGSTVVNVFERALYESVEAPLPAGFLHTSYWVDDIDQVLATPAWAAALLWGPETLQGSFGKRRVAFFELLPGLRVELMQDLEGSEPDMAGRLAAIGAATLYEAAGRVGALDPAIRAFGPPASPAIAGPALTVGCHPGDNLAVHRAIAEAAEGEVLIIDGAGLALGYMGDVLGVAALARGVVGAVIDGGVRDLAELATLCFPVWARAAAIPGTTKVAPGTVSAPITCGGVAVEPGDWIVADADGVVAIGASHVAEVVIRAEQRGARERAIQGRLRAGELTLDLMELRASAT